MISCLFLIIITRFIFFFQVEWINSQIDNASRDSPLYRLPPVVDPSNDMQLVHISWMKFFLLSRKPGLSEADIANLHAKAADLLNLLSSYLPDRCGKTDRRGEIIGWNIWKAHDLLHDAWYRMKFGYSEITSAQGAECAHNVHH